MKVFVVVVCFVVVDVFFFGGGVSNVLKLANLCVLYREDFNVRCTLFLIRLFIEGALYLSLLRNHEHL